MGFLYGFGLTVLAIVAVLLIAVVLLQSGKGGGVAASFGGASSSSDAVLGTRQAGNLLTKASWWLGGIFLGLSFVLGLASTRRSAPRSILDETFSRPPATAPAAPAPGTAAPNAAPALPLDGGTSTANAPATATPAPQP